MVGHLIPLPIRFESDGRLGKQGAYEDVKAAIEK